MKLRARIAENFWRRRCLKFSVPPKQIVYEEGAEAARLLQYNHYDPIGERPDGGHVAGFVPTCWRKLEVKKTSRSLRAALLFMHERRSERGRRQLVAITYSYVLFHKAAAMLGKTGREGFGDIHVPPQMHVLIYDVGEWSRGPRCQSADCVPAISDAESLDVSKTVRFYAGQCDPEDDSKFTIDYEVDGERGVLRWRLSDLPHGEKMARLGRTVVEYVREGPMR